MFSSRELVQKAESLVVGDHRSIRPASAPVERERYAKIDANRVNAVAEAPASTFSIDLDTGAYALVRRCWE